MPVSPVLAGKKRTKLLPFRLWLGKKVFGYIGMGVGVRIGPTRMIKWRCEQPEVEGHLYAAQNTTIPVPKVYRIYHLHGKLAIEMEYLRGCEELGVEWRSLSAHQKQALVNDIGAYIKQLRALRPPVGFERRISSTNGGPFRDTRLGTNRLFGPFNTSAEFHDCVRLGMAENAFGPKVMQVHSREYECRFTHGDLGAQNILIRNGKFVAIIDWENAGWFPEYYEYTKARYNSVLLPEFYEMLAEVTECYDEEWRAERDLWRDFDQPYDKVLVDR